MDIFEGTEQIQQLVISRVISGLRIEQRVPGKLVLVTTNQEDPKAELPVESPR